MKPIVFGNISRYLGKKREVDGRTHLWTAFLRPFDPREDMSVYIRRVQFKLHDSYPNPVRIFHRPPYEVTETGWGEFDIVIKVRPSNLLESTRIMLWVPHLLNRKIFPLPTHFLNANIESLFLAVEFKLTIVWLHTNL